MLIVCPNCATSYMIDRAALGPAGRAVRCARCKTTWFADGIAGSPRPTADISAEADGVAADSAAQSSGTSPAPRVPATPSPVDNPPTLESAPPVEETAAKPDEPLADGGEPTPSVEPESPTIDAVTAKQADSVLPPTDMATANSDKPAAAEPMPVADAPSLVPPDEPAPLPETVPAEPEAEEVESFAARRQRLRTRRTRSIQSSRWTALILLLVAFNVAVIGARNEVVRYLPQTASLFATIGLPVNLRHLKFENVRIAKDNAAAQGALIVEGTIVSTASQPIEVPRLRFAARNAAGQEVYTWTALPSRSILDPDGKLDFRSRLASAPADANSVMVRFFTREDADAGEK